MPIHECPYCNKSFSDKIPDTPPSLTLDGEELAKLIIASISHFTTKEKLLNWIFGIKVETDDLCLQIANKIFTEYKDWRTRFTGLPKISAIKALRQIDQDNHIEVRGLKEAKEWVEMNMNTIMTHLEKISI